MKFIAYETECKNGQCIAPVLSPYPVKIEIDTTGVGTYKYRRGIGNTNIESSLQIQKGSIGEPRYKLTISTQYVENGVVSDHQEGSIVTNHIYAFAPAEIEGTEKIIGDTTYTPAVGTYPEGDVDLCQ